MSGRSSLDVGKDTERRVAEYLRRRGLAGVERAVRTGFRTSARTVADTGDLTGWPGVCVQVKSLRPATAAERAVRGWLRETEQQRAASGASVGLLIVRRWGTTDVGEWWAFLDLATVLGMAADAHYLSASALIDHQHRPVRLELSDLVDLMQTWGWAPCPDPATLEENR